MERKYKSYIPEHNISKKKTTLDSPTITIINELIPLANEVFRVYNLANETFDYVSPNHEIVLGVPPSEWKETNFNSIFQRMPLDDKELVNALPTLFESHFTPLNQKDISTFCWSYDFKISQNSEIPLHIFQTNYFLSLGEENKISHIATRAKPINHLKRENSPTLVRFGSANTTIGLYRKYRGEDLKPVKQLFTPTEKYVLDFLTKGYSSKGINEHLAGSVNTINLHRKRLCQKTGARDGVALAVMHLMGMW